MKSLRLKTITRRLSNTHDALFSDAVTPVMLSIVSIIFAVELTANIANGSGAIALMHLLIIGLIELLILGMLGALVVRKTRSFFRARATRVRGNQKS